MMTIGNYVEDLGDNRFLVKTRPRRHLPHDREIIVEEGKEYVIVPINPNCLKNRNRQCVFISGGGTEAKVRFLDKGQIGSVGFDELVELSELDRIQASLELLRKKTSPEWKEPKKHPTRDLESIAQEFSTENYMTFRGQEVLVLKKTKKRPDMSAGGFLYKIMADKGNTAPKYIGGPRAFMLFRCVVGYMLSSEPFNKLQVERSDHLNPEEIKSIIGFLDS